MLEMYYHWHGPEQAPPLVWLAGLGQDHLAWGLQGAVFSKKFRCLMLDSRDVGRSGRATEFYSGADMATDLAGLLDALHVPKISVVGLSLGGVIAQEFALHYPTRLDHLALISTFPGGDNRLASLAASWATMYSTMPVDDFMRAANPWLFTWRVFQQRPVFLDTLVRHRTANLHSPDAAAFARQSNVLVQQNALDRLTQITAPTLVLVGDEDIVTPPRLARQLAEGIPGARLEIIPEAGHGGVAEMPDPFNRLLMKFFEELL
jgi:pimeloyl-ACP methyl ester carboxylesterase